MTQKKKKRSPKNFRTVSVFLWIVRSYHSKYLEMFTWNRSTFFLYLLFFPSISRKAIMSFILLNSLRWTPSCFQRFCFGILLSQWCRVSHIRATKIIFKVGFILLFLFFIFIFHLFTMNITPYLHDCLSIVFFFMKETNMII